MKKLLALLLALLLTFQLVTPVFAEEIEETQAATEAVEVETEAPMTDVPTTEPPVPETAVPEETSAPTEPQTTTEITEATASTEETTTASTEPTEETTEPTLDLFAEDENVIASGTCGAQGENLTWVLTEDGNEYTLTISGDGEMENYGYYSPWSNYEEQIATIVLKPGMTSIGSYAFRGCTGMNSITIPEGVGSIGDEAFEDCTNLINVSIPVGVTSIGHSAFYGCSKLTRVTIPASVTNIGQSAFCGCTSLNRVVLSEGVTAIGSSAFYGCSNLTTIKIPAGVTQIAYQTFRDCSSLTSVEIPDGVTVIDSYAFYNCSKLTSIELPNSVTEIGASAFKGCWKLASINIPNSVASIEREAFSGCGSLTSIEIPEGITSLQKETFYNCGSLENITLPESLTSIADKNFYGVFENCYSLKSITIPGNVTSIGSDAFRYCTTLKDIYYGGSVGALSRMLSYTGVSKECALHGTAVDNGACGKGLTWLLGNDEILTISGSGIMRDYSSSSDRTTAPWGTYWKQVNTVRIESGVTDVGNFAFAGCGNLESIEMPVGLTSIGKSAFSGCSTLPTLSIPKSVTTIGSAAFSGCTSLGNIYYEGSLGVLKRMLCYAGVPDGCALHGTAVDNGACGDRLAWTLSTAGILTISGSGDMRNYSDSTSNGAPWNTYREQINAVVLEPGITSIGDYAFTKFDNLTDIQIPDSVTSIGEWAFYDCGDLTSVKIPACVASIGERAFYKCKGLTRADISAGNVGNYAFYNCTGLTSVTIQDDVHSIGDYAFADGSKLTSISIPTSVTQIGRGAFFSSGNLMTDITFAHRGRDILSIGSRAFGFGNSVGTPVYTTVHVPSVKTMNSTIRDYNWESNSEWHVTFEGSAEFPMESLALGTKDGATQYELGTAVEFTVTPEPIDTTDDYVLTILPEKTTAQARLSKDGVLTTLSTGTVTVQAQCVQNPAISDEITLTVLPPTGILTSLTVTTLNDYPGDAELGKPVQMIPVFTPTNAADRSVTWSVENGTGTATIDENGLLTPLTVGTVTVYAMTPDGIEGASTVNIVRYAEEITILLNGKEDISRLGAGESLELSFRLSPEDTTTKEVEWSVTNQTGWAKLNTRDDSNYAKLEGKRAGTVILTATAKDSKQVVATKELTITDTVRSYALPDGSGSLYYNTETGWITGADETVKNVLIPAQIDGVTIVGIDPYAFTKRDSYNGYVEANTTLTSVSIPNTIVEIGESAFAYCTALSTVRFASGSKLTTIGENAFYQCSSITSLTIPDSVQSIGDKAFCYLENLKYLTVSGEFDTTGWLSKDWNGNRCELEKLTLTGQYVCKGIKNTHDWGDDWRSIPGRNAKKVILSEGITEISDGAFSNCGKIEQVVFPSSLKAIGEYAFDDCRSIEQIDFPANLQAIGKRAFSNCSSLNDINLPSSIETLGEGCFYSCGNLQVLDMSKVPDTFIEKETRLTGMVTFPTWLVRATNGKAEMYWDMLDDNGYGHASQDSRTKQWYLYAYRAAKGSLICRDSYTGICGSKEIEIKTGIVIRPADTGYLVSGGKIALSAWNMPSEEKASVDWSLAYGGEDYASIDSSGVLTAKTVHAAQQITVIAQPRDGGEGATKSIWILPKTTGLGLLLDGAPLGSTLSVEQSQTNTLQLSAKVYPDGALQEMQWTSSAENVARVDDTGLVTLVQPGTAVIKAATKDGSKLTAQVTLYVTYVDSAGKLTLTAAAMPEIGLQPGQGVRLTLRGEEKIPAENVIFSVPASQSAMGSIDENGRFTAGNTPGKVTVTAALKGDPLGRTASITIPVIPAQAAKLSLTATLPGGPGQLVNGMVIFDQADMKRDVFFSVKAQAYDRLGQSLETDLLWSSTDSSIAEVDWEGNVTVKAGVNGQCAIVATAQDFAQATGSILISVRDYSPRLGTATMKLNTALTQGTVVDLVESYGNAIRSVTVNDNRFSVDYEDNLLTLRAGEGVTKGTYPMTLSVLCDNGQTYPYFITVKATQTLPKLTVKQTEKFNLFCRDSQVPLVITGGEVESAELIGTDDFVLENNDGTYVIRYAEQENVPEKPDTKVSLSVRFAGYSVPVTKALTIATASTAPKLTLNPAASTLNSAVQGDLTVHTSILGVSDALTVWTDMEGVEVEISGDELAITLTEAKTTTVNLFVLADNWAKPVKLTHKITVTEKRPTLKAASGNLRLNSRFPSKTASTGLILSQGNVDLSDVTLMPAARMGTAARVESDKLNVEYDPISGRITAKIADSSIKNGTYAFHLAGTLTSGTEISGGALKVTVTNALPKVKLSASTVKLNQRLAGQETAAVAVTLTGEDCTLEGFENLPEGMDFADGVLTVALPDGNSTSGSYSLHAVVSRNGEEVTLPAPLILKVQTYDKAPTVKLSAKGKLDVLNPASEIVYTPKLTNCLGTVEDVQLTGADCDLFEAEVVDGRIHLTMVEGGEYATRATYKVTPVLAVCGRDITAPTLSIKVTQSALKLAKLPNRTVYQSQTAPLAVKLAVTNPASAKIGDVQLNAKTTAPLRNALEAAGGIQADEATVSFPAKAFAALNPGRYTVILDVFPANAATDTKPTQVRFTLTVQK